LIGGAQFARTGQLAEAALIYHTNLQPGASRYTERLRVLRGEIQFANGDIARAESSVREALANQDQMFDATSPQIAQTLDVLGAILRAQAHYAEAIKAHSRALAIHVKAFGTNHVQALRSATYLAVARVGDGEPTAASDFASVRDALGAELGADHPAQKQLARAEAWVALSPRDRSARNLIDRFRLIDF
jgi:tetratricopeptide (TPR) repeat protein